MSRKTNEKPDALTPMRARRSVKPAIEPAAKRALLERHGGLEGASEEQLAATWAALTPADRARYRNPPTEQNDQEESGDR